MCDPSPLVSQILEANDIPHVPTHVVGRACADICAVQISRGIRTFFLDHFSFF